MVVGKVAIACRVGNGWDRGVGGMNHDASVVDVLVMIEDTLRW